MLKMTPPNLFQCWDVTSGLLTPLQKVQLYSVRRPDVVRSKGADYPNAKRMTLPQKTVIQDVQCNVVPTAKPAEKQHNDETRRDVSRNGQ